MLILSRRIGQQIVIGEGPEKVVVTVSRINWDRVSVGVEAPKEVKILRGELRPFEPHEQPEPKT